MESFSALLAGVLRGFLRLVLVVFTVSLVISLVCVALVATVLTMLWSLLTGRKPAAYTTFMRFRQTAQQFRQGGWAARADFARDPQENVVDVQASEVHSEPVLSHDKVPGQS